MKIFTALEITPLGSWSDQFGQTYWGQVEEQDKPVRFNLMKAINIEPGSRFIAGEHEEKQGAKSAYTQLRKVRVAEAIQEEEQQEMDIPLTASEPDAGYLKARKVADEIGQRAPKPQPSVVGEVSGEPSYEAGTNARWALKLATDTYKSVMGGMPDSDTEWTAIEDFAKWLLGAFARLKNYRGEDDVRD